MKITNKSGYTLRHGDIVLGHNKTADIEECTAKKWLEIQGVEEYTDPAEIVKANEAKKEAELKAEIEKAKAEALAEANKEKEAEIKKLKAEIEKFKKTNSKK